MNQQDPDKIQSVEQLPVKNRKKTDYFCMIFFASYFVLLALICFFIHTQENLKRMTYPNDNQGKLCGYDPQVASYPYLYYTSLTDPTKRLCVNECPRANATQLSCKPTSTLGCRPNSNPKYEVTIYNTYLDQGRIGLFCLPTDNTIKDIILKMSNTQQKYAIYSAYDAIINSVWTALISGLFIFFLTHFWPHRVVPWMILIGGIFSIIFAVFVLALSKGYLLAKIIIAIFFFSLSFISFKTLYDSERRKSVVVCTRLIGAATLTHTDRTQIGELSLNLTNFINLWKPLALIVCFALLYIGFFFIHMREILSVWSVGKLVFVADKPFYAVTGFGSNFLMLLVGIQLIWGSFIIKQAYNFIVAGEAVTWYFGQDEPSFIQSGKLLLSYHLGSVIGGSFLQGFLYFVELYLNFFYDEQAPKRAPVQFNQQASIKNPQRVKQYGSPIQYDRQIESERTDLCRSCKSFYDLVKGSALAYVYLVGIPYCNAARYCEFLSSHSPFYSFGQTTNRILRINMHFVPMFIVLFVGIFQMGPLVTPYSILIVAILSYFFITFFLSYHGQKAQGLLISLYTEEGLSDGYLDKAPKVLKQTYQDDLNQKHHGIGFCQLLTNKDKIIVQEQV